MATRGPLPSWVWLLLAAGCLVFAVVWWSQSADGVGESVGPSPQDNGRQPLPQGGDFSNVRRDRPIEPREATAPSIVRPAPGSAPAAPWGAGGAGSGVTDPR